MMRGMIEIESLLTSDQVAKWLGYSARTICYWAECAHLPAMKVGRQWRFKRSDVELWLKQRVDADLGKHLKKPGGSLRPGG